MTWPGAFYRKFLPLYGIEGQRPLNGSFFSEHIEDYYCSPYELGYGRSIFFNHDFIGRAALEKARGNVARTKVTLVFDPADMRTAQGEDAGFQLTYARHRVEAGPRLTLLEAGQEFGLRQVGGRAYASVATEHGWIANTVPAIYTGHAMQAYREWLPGRGFEANLSLGGSFSPDRVDDLYTTPWDLGYGHIVKFDHDFIGRPALEQLKERKHRRKAWLSWHRDDVARIFASMYEPAGQRFKYIDMPAAFYAGAHGDRVEKNGQLIGVSTLCSYSSNVCGWISVCMINEDDLGYGDEVELVWGEPGGKSANPTVEQHTQTTIRATVSRRPFFWDKH
jgi:glycine cleavage system aminomethyltransferase T